MEIRADYASASRFLKLKSERIEVASTPDEPVESSALVE